MTDSEVASATALAAIEGTQLEIDTSTVDGAFDAVFADLGGRVVVTNSEISGGVFASTKSLVKLEDVDHTSNAVGVNGLALDSALELSSDSSLRGDITIDSFSKLLVRDSSSVDGSLSCGSAGDAFCDNPVANVTGTSNCGQCPKR